MERYKNGKVYRMNVGDEIYVGSTCAPLPKRKGEHKRKSKVYPNRRLYKAIMEIGWENVSIILIEEYPCNNKMELERRERYWIDELRPSLNIQIPRRTKHEWNDDNKEHNARKMKEYYQTNKEHLSRIMREYREAKREIINGRQNEKVPCPYCQKFMSRTSLSRHKKTQHPS